MNPFTKTPFYHYFLAFDLISNPTAKVLDFGCGSGQFLGKLHAKVKNVYGYDVDPEKINLAQHLHPHVKFKLGRVGAPLPYPDATFDVVNMFHILEHVSSETMAILETHRLLKKNGLLFLASPYQGLFSWADAANLRYRFPNLHKWFFITFLGKYEYERRFVSRRSIGMYGDCTDNRNWHKHYTEGELRQLLGNKFTITEVHKFSLFYPFLLIPYNLINYFFKPKFNSILWLIHLDNLINAGGWSYNFLIVARKK
ncbi:MAG: class I SAM-dependent methyltransferase [Patescibacteria group bacterium]